MNKQELKEKYPQTVFGTKFAVTITKRTNPDNFLPIKDRGKQINPLVIIWSEDDENWSKITDFDISHVKGLVKALTTACSNQKLEWNKHILVVNDE